MKTTIAPKTKMSFSLVKWDGDAPPNWREIEKPQEHEKCAEIVAWDLGQPKQTVYKRGES